MSARDELGGGTAVVTGAGSGLGEAFARHLAQLSMRVVLADVAADRIDRVAADIRAAGGEALAVPTDVTDPKALDSLAAQTQAAFGDVRLLMNNAGIEVLGLIWEISAETWAKAIAVNVLGIVNGIRAFLPGMLASGKPGFVANTASIGSFCIIPVQTPYILSKHAVLALTEGLAVEVAMTGKPISVSAVLPGPVKTRIFDDAPRVAASSAVEGHEAEMNALLRDQGMAPDEAAALIVEGIAARHFWVSSHPRSMAELGSGRASYLQNLARPGPVTVG